LDLLTVELLGRMQSGAARPAGTSGEETSLLLLLMSEAGGGGEWRKVPLDDVDAVFSSTLSTNATRELRRLGFVVVVEDCKSDILLKKYKNLHSLYF